MQGQMESQQPDSSKSVFHYKMVAKTMGKYFSIYDGKTEYNLGQTIYQEAISGHKGGYYVYPTVEDVIFADIPFKKGGLFIAPRTVLKCLCWGNLVQYDHGKVCFSYICPVQDMGLPIGYKSSKTALREVLKTYTDKVTQPKNQNITQNKRRAVSSIAKKR